MSAKFGRRLFASFAILLLGLGTVPAFAQDSSQGRPNGFKISPVRTELTVDKGSKQTFNVSVNNPSALTLTSKAIVTNFVGSDDESGSPRLILDENTEAPKNDIRTLIDDIPNFDIAGGGTEEIEVTVNVPSDANSGGYYGAIRFVPEGTVTDATVGLTASVGTLILITVPGDLVQRVDIEQLSAGQKNENDVSEPKGFISSGDVQIITRLTNNGDIHSKPFGRIEVKNMFGKIVASTELNDTEPRGNILPGDTRKFVNEFEQGKLLGRYTIVASLGYAEGGGDIISGEATFWYMPLWATLTAIGLVIALVTGVYILIRRKTGGLRRR